MERSTASKLCQFGNPLFEVLDLLAKVVDVVHVRLRQVSHLKGVVDLACVHSGQPFAVDPGGFERGQYCLVVLSLGKKHPKNTDRVNVQIDETTIQALSTLADLLVRAIELEAGSD